MHCRGAKYVLTYWLEKAFEEAGMHMTDIPPDAFKLIPVEYLKFCHCNIQMVFLRKDQTSNCEECEGTTWQFTEAGEREGYRWKKVKYLEPDEIRTLPCEYFDRCSCSVEDQGPKNPEKKKILKDILDTLRVKIPIPRFGFNVFSSAEPAVSFSKS